MKKVSCHVTTIHHSCLSMNRKKLNLLFMSTIRTYKTREIFRLSVMILIPCKRVILGNITFIMTFVIYVILNCSRMQLLKMFKRGYQVFQWSYFTKQQIQSENVFESKNEIKSKCLVNLTIPFYIITNS